MIFTVGFRNAISSELMSAELLRKADIQLASGTASRGCSGAPRCFWMVGTRVDHFDMKGLTT